MDIEEVPPSNESEEKGPPPGQRRAARGLALSAAEPHRAYNIFASAAHHIGAHKPDGLERARRADGAGLFCRALHRARELQEHPDHARVLERALEHAALHHHVHPAHARGLHRRGHAAEPPEARRHRLPHHLLHPRADELGRRLADLEERALPAVRRAQRHPRLLRHRGPRLAAGRKLGHAGHRARLSVEGHGLFRSYTALRHDRHKPKLL